MGCAPMAHVLWSDFMKYSAKDPAWINRDRFVLSNGHACALQYTMLHLTGYPVSLEDLKKFRKLGSITPGHPESFVTKGVEVCTGPLGQGISNAVGLAIAERHLAAEFNTPEHAVFDHFTYVLCGDGCLQEGVSSEACSLAGHLGLGRIIVLYDDNHITIDGETHLSFTEDVLKRFEAYGWHTQTVSDVTGSLQDLRSAIAAAQAVSDKPSIIKVRTDIGYGSPSKQGKESAHGAPLGEADLRGVKTKFGFPPDQSFYVPPEVKAFYEKASAAGDAHRLAWEDMFAKYAAAHPDKAAEVSRRFAHKLPAGLLDKLPAFHFGVDKDNATRKFSQAVLNAVAPSMPELVGGSADLTPSNCTDYKGVVDFQKGSEIGRYLRFGVREHGMVAVCNGIFAHGGLRPYCATFLVFAGYALGAIRLSALSRFGVIFVFTHDSIGLGEDGPTHQPVETLETLRCLPNLNVFRPADMNETSAAYKVALERVTTPTVICCTRTNVPALELSSIDKACQGAYAVVEADSPQLVLVATGSEVGICVKAAKVLHDESGVAVRVVSMPCQELFLEQTVEYQRSVLPGNVPTLSVEASMDYGWHRFSHAQISMHRFGASGDGDAVFAKFGFTTDNVVDKARAVLEFYKKTPVPDLHSRPVFESVLNGH
jgi:transketolase